MGGYDDLGNGNWSWVDGQAWSYTRWDTENANNLFPKDDPKKTKMAFYHSTAWRNYSPRARFPFVCRKTETIAGVENRRWEYKVGDLSSNKITVRWEYRHPGKEVLAGWEEPRRTGFNLSWYVADQSGKQIAKTQEEEGQWTQTTDQIPMFTNDPTSFVALVNAAQQALDKQLDHSKMMKVLMEHITSTRENIHYHCLDGQRLDMDMRNIMTFLSKLNLTYDYAIMKNISEVALTNGLEIYSTIQHCPPNKYMDLVMKDFFHSFKSPRDLLQGTVNLLNSGTITNPANIAHLNQFCHKLLDLQH